MMARAVFIGLLMLLVGIGVATLDQNTNGKVRAPALDALLPGNFEGWQEIELSAAILPAEVELSPGEAVAYRAYRDSIGRVVTLVVAYGPPLGDSVRLHRPEICYVAQGFSIVERHVARLHLEGGDASIVRMRTENTLRSEDVSYWLRDGDHYVTNAHGAQALNFRRALSGPADSVLVRVSTTGKHAAPFGLHDRFLKGFSNALSPEARALLIVGVS